MSKQRKHRMIKKKKTYNSMRKLKMLQTRRAGGYGRGEGRAALPYGNKPLMVGSGGDAGPSSATAVTTAAMAGMARRCAGNETNLSARR